jgi:DNA-binding protein YbaB
MTQATTSAPHRVATTTVREVREWKGTAVPTDHRAQVEELMADYRRSRQRLAATQQELSSITETAGSDGIQVTVGPQGVLRDLVISDEAYRRHRPAQLAAAIVRLTAEAARSASRRAAEVLAPVLPPGTDAASLLEGRGDLEPNELARNDSPVLEDNGGDDTDEDEDFTHTSWLQGGTAKRTHP